METTRSTFRRWFLLPGILVSLHSAIVLWAGWSVASSPDAETGLVWLIPYYLDYPASLLLLTFGMSLNLGAPVLTAFFFVLGLLYWGIMGSLIQALWRFLSLRSHAKAA